MNNIGRKLFYLVLGSAVLVCGLFIASSYFDFSISQAFSPPPASRAFLLMDDSPSISKDLCSAAAQTTLTASCYPASVFADSNFPVNRGEELTINIKYQPPTQVSDDEQYPRLVEIRETLPGGGFFSYQGAQFSGDARYDSANLPSIGQVLNSRTTLRYRFNDYRPEEPVELTIRLKAVRYTIDGSISIDLPDSYVEYEDDDREKVDLPEARVEITDIIGPRGDIYSHGSIDNSRRNVLGVELDRIDVIAARGSITGFNNNPDWQLENHQAKMSDQTYRNEKYADFYRAKIGKRLELLKNEADVDVGHSRNTTSRSKPFVYYPRNYSKSGGQLSFSSNKTIIVEGNINLSDVTINSNSHGVVFVSVGGNIKLTNRTNSLMLANAHFLAVNGSINIDNRGPDSHLIVDGSLASKSFNLLGNNRVTYSYNPNGLTSLPGIAGLYNPQPFEHY